MLGLVLASLAWLESNAIALSTAILSAWILRKCLDCLTKPSPVQRQCPQTLRNHEWRRAAAVRTLKKIRKLGCRPFGEAKILTYLRKIDPFVFEELLLLAFRDAGWIIVRNTRYTGDHGIDGRLVKGNLRFAIQAKRYKGHIRRADVNSFSDCLDDGEFGFFVHTGRTGAACRKQNGRVSIISGRRLINLILHQKLDTVRAPCAA